VRGTEGHLQMLLAHNALTHDPEVPVKHR
jgi:hypothetical protein